MFGSSTVKRVSPALQFYSHPQIDGKVNHHQISRDLLFHLFGDDYIVSIASMDDAYSSP